MADFSEGILNENESFRLMKTLLVPTDFSESAYNAVNYAIGFARVIPSRIILFHSYRIPVPVMDMDVAYTSPPTLAEHAQGQLEEYANALMFDGAKGIQIESVTNAGFAAEEIADLATARKIDFIIMGVSIGGRIGHALFGSTTTGVLERVTHPLIIVPEHAKFAIPSRVAFACDYELKMSSRLLKELKILVRFFKARLFVINVESPGESISSKKAISSLQVETALKGTDTSIHYLANDNVIKSLMEFEDMHLVDLLVMIPQRHSGLDKIFHPSQTRKMIFQTHIPILALHE
jgi:nucleotide-binding universal stress UspA family protein